MLLWTRGGVGAAIPAAAVGGRRGSSSVIASLMQASHALVRYHIIVLQLQTTLLLRLSSPTVDPCLGRCNLVDAAGSLASKRVL
jgi:hypothetical protein